MTLHADVDLPEPMAELSLKQKERLLTGANLWSLHPEFAVGLRCIVQGIPCHRS